MRIEHALHRRTVFCIGLGLALLGHFPIAHAINKNSMSKFGFNTNGNSVSVGPLQPGKTWANTATVSGSNNTGNVGQQIGSSGWYVGGNPPPGSVSGSTMLTHGGDTFFAGTKYPFQAGYTVPPATIFEMASSLVGGPLGVGLMLASPFLADWINKADPSVRVNPSSGQPEIARNIKEKWCALDAAQQQVVNACRTKYSAYSPFVEVTVQGDICTHTVWTTSYLPGSVAKPSEICLSAPKKVVNSIDWQPASMDDIAPYMSKRPDPNILPELLNKGGELNLPNPIVSGPASVPGPSETSTSETTNPDGTKSTVTTTKTTDKKFSTSGNTITNTSTTTNTTVTTCGATGACTTTNNSNSTVITKPVEEQEEQDQCEKNPDSLACAETDTPEEEIPKATKELTYSEDTMFSGGGSCPADKVMTLHTGQTVKVWDWQQGCSWIVTYVRPILLVVASYIAVMMLVPKT